MMWLIIICLCVLALLIVFLFAPITVRSSSDGEKHKTELRYLGMRFQIKRDKRPEKRKKKRRRARAAWEPERLLDIWDNFTLADFRAFPRFLKALLTHLNLRVTRFHVRLATPDPALTGILSGWAHAVASCLPKSWPIRIESSFDEEIPRVYYEAEVRVRPIEPLWDVIHLALHLPLWRLARSWRQLRK